MKRTAGLLALLALCLIGCQEKFEPVAFDPPPSPALEGALAPNPELQKAEILGVEIFDGAEDVAPTADGWLYGGNESGKIMRMPIGDAAGRKPEVFADTGGRPLGLDFDPEGNLIVADAAKGLLRVSATGDIETLATEAGDVPFRFTDDVDVGRDGMIYFSDASSKWGMHNYMLDALEGRPWGRLLRYDPATRKTEILLSDLYFANGIALSANEDFVLVNETYRFRITRYWLKGTKAGTHDIFIDDLPGYPDGVSSDGKGTFWLALFTVRNPAADFLAPKPTLRELIAALPPSLWPKPEPYGFILGLSEGGEILYSLQDPSGEHARQITSVEATDDALFLGTLHGKGVWRYPVPIGSFPRTGAQ